jgi:uncharacterized protein YciI
VETLFSIVAWDGPDAARLRDERRDAHLAYVEANLASYRVAGPLYDESGAFAGSLLVVAAPDFETAHAIFIADPYFTGGVWGRHHIHRLVAAAGSWVGGIRWKEKN